MKTNTKTTTNARPQAETDRNGFAALLRNYETATRNRNGNADTENTYTTALQELGKACAFSVLKKLCNVGGTVTEQTKSTTDTAKTIRQLRQTLAKDLHDLDRLTYSTNNATALEYNADGDLETVIKDADLHKASADLIAECFAGDGLDLVNTAILTIMTETAKQTDLTADFMEKPYTVRRLKRKVYIKEADTQNGYETATTTAVQEVYKAIRRDIESNRSMQMASHKYTYISDIITDTETDTETEVFRRLPKYSGLAYEQTDINGKVIAITADSETVRDTDEIISKLNLTTKQAKVLQLRQSGYGYKAIATYLGITVNSVTSSVRRIQDKCKDIGFMPVGYTNTEKKSHHKKTV